MGYFSNYSIDRVHLLGPDGPICSNIDADDQFTSDEELITCDECMEMVRGWEIHQPWRDCGDDEVEVS